jgi:signal transduction histidine kinase
MVKPVKRVVRHMEVYAQAPEDARRIITPQATITELRSAEEALAAMQTQLTGSLKQKERLAQLGGAVAKISHDLRNILTTATLLADRMERSEDPAVKRSAPKLVNSLSRAVNLCEGTLAFGRVEEPPPSLSMVPLSNVVDDVLEGERLASGGSVEFIDEIEPGMIIRADSEQLFRVLGNLVRNARQAIEATGTPGTIKISAEEKELNWEVTVCDTGPGLPPKAQEHLFMPFEGGVRKGGTGLGLVIASELVRGHGGALNLTRTDETGTEFVLRLPKHPLEVGRAAE